MSSNYTLAIGYLLALCFLYGAMIASFAVFGIYLMHRQWVGSHAAFVVSLWGTAGALLLAFVRIRTGG